MPPASLRKGPLDQLSKEERGGPCASKNIPTLTHHHHPINPTATRPVVNQNDASPPPRHQTSWRSTANDGTAESDTNDRDGSGNYAIVTIGTTSYEVPADPLNLCNSVDNLIFGSYATDASGQATQAGGPDVSIQVNFGVPATDWQDQGLQPPTLNVDLIDGGVRWFASTERGLGAVDSWQLTDGKATGEASFVGEVVGSGEEVGAETGSFEVVCR